MFYFFTKRLVCILTKILPTIIPNLAKIFFIIFLIFNPVLYADRTSNITPDGSTDTNIDTAQNGITIINIADPNSGVSINNYDDFNISSDGAVFNNSPNAGNSHLAGAIVGNNNLQHGFANIILNQITGSQGSNLLGYMEVYGKQAELIIANPNGIYCNGCGFINTSKVQLVTGNAIVNNHLIDGYNISKQGLISIDKQ